MTESQFQLVLISSCPIGRLSFNFQFHGYLFQNKGQEAVIHCVLHDWALFYYVSRSEVIEHLGSALLSLILQS